MKKLLAKRCEEKRKKSSAWGSWLTDGLVGSASVEDAGNSLAVNVLVVFLDATAHGVVEGAVCHLMGGVDEALEGALGQEVGAVLGGDGPDARSNEGDCGDLHCD